MIAGRHRTTDTGAPPAPPDVPPEVPVDQGPMRSELLRQIALLEQQLARIQAHTAPWTGRRATPRRGPARLSTADLERVRDELVEAIHTAARAGDGPA